MLLLFILGLLLNSSESKVYKANETDFSKCTVYYSRHGSGYRDFFEFHQKPGNGTLLDFHFSVLVMSDAHILLAPSKNLQADDPVYEIVIGAGGNTFSDIRRKQKSAVKATTIAKDLLSTLDIKSFWIHISTEGIIEVGKEGEEVAFLTWTDPDPLPIRVFSMSTWQGIEAKWYFDCPKEEINATKLERVLTPLEKLRRDLLFGYDPYVRPVRHVNNITLVDLQLSTNLISLDEHKSQFQYNGAVTLSWKDEKLRWNASDYGNIEKLHIFRREIWVPNLYLFNAANDGNDILEDTLLVVDRSGHVNWITTIKLESWCNLRGLDRWPRDEHSCEVILGFFKEYENMQLNFKANESVFSSPYSLRWHIFEVQTFANAGWKNESVRNMGNFDPPALNLRFKLRRISNSFSVSLYTPFYVISTFSLVAFWMSPFSKVKLSLVCLQMVAASMMLIGLALIIPTQIQLVPTLVLLYSYGLVASVVCAIIEIVVINFSRVQHGAAFPHMLKTIIVSSTLRLLLCLPEIKECDERYGSSCATKSQLMVRDPQRFWILLGIIVDRIAFFVYLGLFVSTLSITY